MLKPDVSLEEDVVGVDYGPLSGDLELEIDSGATDVLVGESSTRRVVEYVGRLRVTVVGVPEGRNRQAVVALHDICTNAVTCFGQFVDFCQSKNVKSFVGSVQYYVDAPGHEESAPTMPEGENWYSLEDIADELHKVVERFQLKRILGLGVGAGARVLLDYASRYHGTVRGLILVSPVIHAASIPEWLTLTTSVRYTSYAGWNEQLKKRLLARWLSEEQLVEGNPVRIKYESALNRLNPFNTARLLSAYAKRKDISKTLSKLRFRALIITGTASQLYEDSLRAFASFDPSNTTIIELRGCGSLCLDEENEKSAEAVKLYLEGLGAL